MRIEGTPQAANTPTAVKTETPGSKTASESAGVTGATLQPTRITSRLDQARSSSTARLLGSDRPASAAGTVATALQDIAAGRNPASRGAANVAIAILGPGVGVAATPINLPSPAQGPGAEAPRLPGGGVAATPINLPSPAQGPGAEAPRHPGGGVAATPIPFPQPALEAAEALRNGTGAPVEIWKQLDDATLRAHGDALIQTVLHRAFIAPNANLHQLTQTEMGSTTWEFILEREDATLRSMLFAANSLGSVTP